MIAADARIIAFAVARIGDTLLVTPALRALRAACPQGSLTVCAHPKRMAVLAHLPFIDRLQPASRARRALDRLRSGARFDWGFAWGDDPTIVRYALHVAQRVVAFESGDPALDRHLHCAVERAQVPEHAVLERLRLAAAVGVETTEHALAYRVTAEEAVAARTRLGSLFPAPPRPLVALQPKSFPTKSYRDWPQASFETLAQRIVARHPGCGIVMLGDTESTALGHAFAARFPECVRNLAGVLDLRETAAVISACDLYVGVDTGPTHLAGALGVPMVALYHCRHRGRLLAPLQHPALEVIEHPAPDSACSDESSMDRIDVETVWQAVERRLSQPLVVPA